MALACKGKSLRLPWWCPRLRTLWCILQHDINVSFKGAELFDCTMRTRRIHISIALGLSRLPCQECMSHVVSFVYRLGVVSSMLCAFARRLVEGVNAISQSQRAFWRGCLTRLRKLAGFNARAA